MKKTLTLVLVLMVAASMICVFAPQSSAYEVGLTEDLQINSYTYYTSENTGAFIIVGEVQNVGTQYFHSARIRATIFNSSDAVIAEPVVSYTYADQIGPNEVAPFYMFFTAAGSTTGDLSWVTDGSIDRIEFYCFAGGDEVDESSGLYVVAHDGSVTSNGNYSVTGMLLNRGTGYPERYFVVGTFYDTAGDVAAIGISEYLPRYLAPNNVTSFILGLYDAPSGVGNQITDYSLRIVAEEVLDSVPTATPSPTATASSGSTTTPSITASPSGSDGSTSSNTLYIVIAAVGIAIAVVVLVLLLKRR